MAKNFNALFNCYAVMLCVCGGMTTHIGYDNAAKIAKLALKNKTTLKTEALKSGLVNKDDYEKIVNPKKMIYPE